mmetsp:Transcript_3032/g.10266  ORF Transcript_3032/g.10266 Transcript_3032/m.10266 type:complete len:238 (+) Transcript_3032:180-893(+)
MRNGSSPLNLLSSGTAGGGGGGEAGLMSEQAGDARGRERRRLESPAGAYDSRTAVTRCSLPHSTPLARSQNRGSEVSTGTVDVANCEATLWRSKLTSAAPLVAAGAQPSPPSAGIVKGAVVPSCVNSKMMPLPYQVTGESKASRTHERGFTCGDPGGDFASPAVHTSLGLYTVSPPAPMPMQHVARLLALLAPQHLAAASLSACAVGPEASRQHSRIPSASGANWSSVVCANLTARL